MSEAKDLVVITEPPVEEAPPPPRPAPRPPEPDLAERAMLFVELRPLVTAALIFLVLALLHIVILNIAGVASGLFIGDNFVLLSGDTSVLFVLLAFIAYNTVLPTLLSHACMRAYDEVRPSLILDDRAYGETRAGIVDSFGATRLACGAIWGILLASVFGHVFLATVHGDGTGYALLAVWMYVRIAITFGLLGANIGYAWQLHRRFRAVTAEHLRVDLFDIARLEPVARYARAIALYLIILLALGGPGVAQSDAMVQSAVLLVLGVISAAIVVVGALLGARKSIRAAKKAAIGEVSAYARELWRRAYAGQRLVEAVAVPPLGAMIAVRNEINRLGEWPGGWSVFTRYAALLFIPLLAWFGGPIVTHAIDAFGS